MNCHKPYPYFQYSSDTLWHRIRLQYQFWLSDAFWCNLHILKDYELLAHLTFCFFTLVNFSVWIRGQWNVCTSPGYFFTDFLCSLLKSSTAVIVHKCSGIFMLQYLEVNVFVISKNWPNFWFWLSCLSKGFVLFLHRYNCLFHFNINSLGQKQKRIKNPNGHMESASDISHD